MVVSEVYGVVFIFVAMAEFAVYLPDSSLSSGSTTGLIIFSTTRGSSEAQVADSVTFRIFLGDRLKSHFEPNVQVPIGASTNSVLSHVG